MEPFFEYQPGFYIWNVGFAIGKSSRQLNDWYWKRKGKRSRSLTKKMIGRSGLKAFSCAVNEVLRLRWKIEPGDGIVVDCTSAKPEHQFRAVRRWQRHHPEWVIDYNKLEYLWYRPPYIDDPARKMFDIVPVIPEDPLASIAGENYFSAFRVRPKAGCNDLSNGQITDLLSLVLSS
jgi:hypothetical protein